MTPDERFPDAAAIDAERDPPLPVAYAYTCVGHCRQVFESQERQLRNCPDCRGAVVRTGRVAIDPNPKQAKATAHRWHCDDCRHDFHAYNKRSCPSCGSNQTRGANAA